MSYKDRYSDAVVSFPKKTQAAIFRAEIQGQLSDGAWENTKPYDHWQPWCAADVKVGDQLGYSGFYPDKDGYGIIRQLWDYEWFRQRTRGQAIAALNGLDIGTIVKFRSIAESDSVESLRDGIKDNQIREKSSKKVLEKLKEYDDQDMSNENFRFQFRRLLREEATNDYWVEKEEKILDEFGSWENAWSIFHELPEGESYTEDDLKDDLRTIKKMFKNRLSEKEVA